MLSDTKTFLSSLDVVPKRLMNVVAGYVASLTLISKKHTFAGAAKLAGVDESRICAMMNQESTRAMSKNVFGRALRRKLARLPPNAEITIVIDATITKRSRHVENAGRWHSGQACVWGHKFVNFALIVGGELIPLASLPCLTKKYARETRQKRCTEVEIVRSWVEDLPSMKLLSEAQIRSAIFLLDAGYDAKPIQQMIHAIGATWVMALKSTRAVDGVAAASFFRARKARRETIRLKAGNGGKRSRREYSVQSAEANLKGFGPIAIVRSKAMFRKGKPEKILASSDPTMTGREVLRNYAKRWAIETWHREIKQGFGFGDCKSNRFSAFEAHVNFCLVAYLLVKGAGAKQIRREDYEVRRALTAVKLETTRFGSGERVRKAVDAALQGLAA